MLDPLPADILRFAAIALLALSIGGILTVIRLHWRATREAPRKVGLLPWHVMAVSVAVLLRDVPIVWGIAATLSQPASPDFVTRVGLYAVGAIVLLVALAIVSQTQRRRIHFARSTGDGRRVEVVDEP